MRPRTLHLVWAMVECRRIKPLLQAYLDGELDQQRAALVSKHLDACRRCGLAAETYREIKAGLARLGEGPDREAVRRLTNFVDSLENDEPLGKA